MKAMMSDKLKRLLDKPKGNKRIQKALIEANKFETLKQSISILKANNLKQQEASEKLKFQIHRIKQSVEIITKRFKI
jgi:hypothetical protein